MRDMRKRYDAALKAKVALEAVKGERTMAQLSSDFKVHSNLIGTWKNQSCRSFPACLLVPGGTSLVKIPPSLRPSSTVRSEN